MSTYINIPIEQAAALVPLATDRLQFRKLSPSDDQFMYDLNADREIILYTGDVAFKDRDEAKTFLLNYKSYDDAGMGRWVVVEKSSGALLGWCGLTINEEKLVDVGFRFFKKYWGQGFATESATSCLEHGFFTLGLPSIVGRVAKENKASIRVLEKLGMKYWKDGPCGHIDLALYYRMEAKDINLQE